MNRLLVILLFLTFCFGASAQKNVLTVGIQYKPIFPSEYFNDGPLEIDVEGFTASAKQKYGHNIGLPIRFGITDWFSAESGIAFIQRNYDLNFAYPDSGYNKESSLKIISYQIPIKGIFHIRLGERLYMNTAAGAAMILFPSDVEKIIDIQNGERFLLEGRRGKGGWFQGAFLADVGLEYRTEESGLFYLGASYHLPFQPIMDIAFAYDNTTRNKTGVGALQGSFLTLDVRYYFPEKKLNRQK